MTPVPSFSTVEALRAWSHERDSKMAYMESVDFIDAIFEFLKKEGNGPGSQPLPHSPRFTARHRRSPKIKNFTNDQTAATSFFHSPHKSITKDFEISS